MSSTNHGIIVILSSPSGAGKTTLVKLLSKKKDFTISISHTTRQPRSNELNGKDYFFVSDEKFKSLIEKNEFIEHAKVFNNYYGTKQEPVFESLEKGKNVIFDIDWQGTKQLKSKNINYKILTFFVLPPSREILFKRLSNRDMKDKLIASERMSEFYKDVKHWVDYDYVVINDNLEKCFQEINTIIDLVLSGSRDINYDKSFIEEHIRKLSD